MFREIRKKKNAISPEEARRLLETERRGVLAVIGDDGYPYAVPINYLYCAEENMILFHGARAGHKADALQRCDKVCFTVYGNEFAGEEKWAPYVQSTVVFGRCRPVSDREMNLALCKRFASKYYPDEDTINAEIAISGAAVQMYVITVEHISGKQVQEK